MNATASRSDQRPVDVLPRYFSGEGPVQERPLDYVLLIPSEQAQDPAAVMRQVIADVLARNQYPADEATVDAIMKSMSDGGLDWGRAAGAQSLSEPSVRGGGTDKDGVRGPSIYGYSIVLRQDFQEGILNGAAKSIVERLGDTEESREKVIGILSKLKDLAGATGNKEMEKTLDTLVNTMKTQDNHSVIDGTKAGLSSLKAVMEFAKKSGLDQEASDALGRMTAMFSLPVDAADFCRKAYSVYYAVDPSTGKPLNERQRTNAVLDLAAAGFSIADSAAKVSILFGASETGAALTTSSVATGAGAVIVWVKLMKDVVEKGQDAINNVATLNFNERFPPKPPGASPQDTIAAILHRAERMPSNPQNALSTVARIIDGFDNGSGGTRERFIAFLKKTMDPDDLVDKLASKKFSEISLSDKDLVRLAKHVKGSVNAFMTLEIQDVKHCTLPEGGLKLLPEYAKKKGEYLDHPLPGEVRKTDLTRPEPTPPAPKPPSELEKILFPGLHRDRPFEQVLDGIPQQQRPVGMLSEGERSNLVAALALAADKGALDRVDAIVVSRDGSRLIAIEGDPQSGFARQAHVDIRDAIHQPAEGSLAQLEQARNARAMAVVPDFEPKPPASERTV